MYVNGTTIQLEQKYNFTKCQEFKIQITESRQHTDKKQRLFIITLSFIKIIQVKKINATEQLINEFKTIVNFLNV